MPAPRQSGGEGDGTHIGELPRRGGAGLRDGRPADGRARAVRVAAVQREKADSENFFQGRMGAAVRAGYGASGEPVGLC